MLKPTIFEKYFHEKAPTGGTIGASLPMLKGGGGAKLR